MVERRTHHGICPVSGCSGVLPNPNAIVCHDCYFLAPAEQMRAAIRMKIKAVRTGRPAFVEQVPKHTAAIVRAVEAARRRKAFQSRTEHSHA